MNALRETGVDAAGLRGDVTERPAIVTVPADYVHESRFGFWFLGTRTWGERVVDVAVKDLQRLMDGPPPAAPVVLDIGCGQGKAFPALVKHLKPARLIGVDVDAEGLAMAQVEGTRCGVPVEVLESDCAALRLPDASVDLVFCHQTLHHVVRQEETLAEIFRVLKPGGRLLLAESTREYICSWVIRLLFRHPMHVQKSAEGYLELVRRAGFRFDPRNVSYPYLWWSRSADFGLLERFGLMRVGAPGTRKETLVNVAAMKPA
ncbi:MAG TPA: class I SAM-dependent methyltransferase [Gammaproteobacteria bacterium]|nr:class I SAM-dependent methyltransferase [Gammaproteobacteria bacterium]